MSVLVVGLVSMAHVPMYEWSVATMRRVAAPMWACQSMSYWSFEQENVNIY
jgi:hypothetical protein